MAVDQFVE